MLFGRPGRCGVLSGHVRYDVVIYLLCLGGRGTEKLWVQILHHLSNFSVVIYHTECGRKPQNQCSIHLLKPVDNGKSFILLRIGNALVSPRNEVRKRYAIGLETLRITGRVGLGGKSADYPTSTKEAPRAPNLPEACPC